MWFDLAYSLSERRDRTVARQANRAVDDLESGREDSAGRRAARFDEFADATPEGNLIQTGTGTLLNVTGSRGGCRHPISVSINAAGPERPGIGFHVRSNLREIMRN